MADNEVVTNEEEELRAEDQSSPWQQLRNRVERDSTRSRDFANTVMSERMRIQSDEWQEQRQAELDQVSVAGEIGRGLWGATVNLGAEATILVNEVQEFVLPLRQLYGGSVGALSGYGWTNGVMDAREQFAANRDWLRYKADMLTPDTITWYGGATEGLSQFLVPYLGALKAMKGAQASYGIARAGAFTEATAIGALIDGGLFDPTQGNLSNLIGELNPELQDEVWLFLATDPDDSDAMNRLRNALEGGVIGSALEGIFRTARWAINARKVRNARLEADGDPERMLTTEEARRIADRDPFDELEVTDEDGDILVLARRNEPRTEGEFGLGADEAGKVNALIRGGTDLQIIDAIVEMESRGKGAGRRLYQRLIQEAEERGLRLVSDTSVSDDAARVWEGMARRGDNIVDQRVTNPDNIEIRVDEETGVTRYDTRNNTPVFTREAAEQADEGAARGADDGAPKADVEGERSFMHEQHIRQTLTLDARARKALNEALLAGDDQAAARVLELNDFNIETIDWNAFENPEDIKRLINLVSEVTADHIDTVKGGVQTHTQTKRLANLVGNTGDQVHALFKDVRGEKGIAARFLAARRTMVMAAREAEKLIKESKAAPGDKAKMSAVMRHLQLYSAIQSEVKGAQTEIARALNAMKVLADDSGTNFKEFDEIMRQFGGRQAGSRNFEKYMDSLLDALERGDIDGFNRGVRMTTGERAKNIIVEYVINSMLSSTQTHKINFTSNVVNTILYSIDRTLAGFYRGLKHGDMAAVREVRIDWVRKFSSLGEGWRMARQAWREGAPISDLRQRLEFNTRKAISAEGTAREADQVGDELLSPRGERFFTPKQEAVFDASGQPIAVVDYTWSQRAINTLGNFIRIPGRALIAGDEFFKTINRNTEQSVLAFRTSDEEAIARGFEYGSEQYENYVTGRIKSLLDPKNMEDAAKDVRTLSIEQARKATFQESPTTEGGKLLEKVVNHNRFVKLLIAPFFRTPMNILRQGTVDRMPWGRWIGETREIIANGHPRARAEAIARTYTGVAAMAATYIAVDNLSDPDGYVEIRGKLDWDSSIRDTQSQDYAIRVGDTWHQFNRLDPTGLWLGIVADLHKASVVADDQDESVVLSMGQAAIGTFMSNVVNKTWMKSLADLIDFAEAVSKRGVSDEAAERAWGRFAGGQLGKFLPQFIKTTGRNLEAQITGEETVAREAWTALENIQATLPIWNRDLPARYDNIGRVRTYPTQGFSPLRQAPEAELPIDRELQRLDFTIKPMPRSMAGGSIQLTNEQYSRLNGYVSQVPIDGGTLADALNNLVQREDWPDMTEARQIYEIKLRIQAARQGARALMLRDPEFREQYKEALREDPLALIQE